MHVYEKTSASPVLSQDPSSNTSLSPQIYGHSPKDSIAPACRDPITDLLHVHKTTSLSQTPKTEYTIQHFDLDAIDNAPDRKAQIAKLYNALHDEGFIAIKADKVLKNIKNVYDQTKDYFEQDIARKEKDIHHNYWQSGFAPRGAETGAGFKVPDNKEFFHIPPNMRHWPDGRPEFRAVMEKYHQDMSSCMSRLIHFIMEHLNEDPNGPAFDLQSPANLVRLLHYPMPASDDPKSAVRAAEHHDLNLITLLLEGTSPGLEFLTKDGKWTAVKTKKDHIIVNTGLQLQRWTGGELQSTRHRVINPEGEHINSARYTAVFFGSFSDDFLLTPLKSCIERVCAHMTPAEKEEYLLNFTDVTVKEFRTARLIELGYIKFPTEQEIRKLRGLGLLQEPPAALLAEHADWFT